MERKKLLIADDSEMNRAILANMLAQDFEIVEATNGLEVIKALRTYQNDFSALLLDIVMPEMDGFQVLAEMNRRGWIDSVPVIMISAETANSCIDQAFDLGASDFISRPFAAGVVRRRIINTLLLHAKKQQLLDVVTNRYLHEEKNNEAVIAILDYSLELRCGEGGTHMTGVGHLTRLLLRALLKKTGRYELDPNDLEAVGMAAGLHDIGKVQIPEAILKKPGKLTAEEFEIVKKHTTLGAQLIEQLPGFQNEKVVKYAIEICRRHHERWNGEGYPDGLIGDECPIAAQAAAVADAYDALVSRRSYKDAFSHERALQMIHNGECGSFNPLLLECLDEVSETIVRENAAKGAGQNPNAKHRIVEDLYRERDLTASRMTQQLEEAVSRQNFFTGMSEEMWFEYTMQPSSLQLSRGITKQTGLPEVLVDPMQNPDFLTFIGEETGETIRAELQKLNTDESYAEVTVNLLLDGHLRRCRLAMYVAWSVTERGRCSSLFGKITNVDENYKRMAEYSAMMRDDPDDAPLLPGVASDHILHIKKEQVGSVLQSYGRIYDSVRLVDPDICTQVFTDVSSHADTTGKHCYAVWEKTQRCRSCISQAAVNTRHPQSKIEMVGNDLYCVFALCVEVEGIYYALECVNRIQAGDMQSDDGGSLLNQLLMRNRQVYTDSLTKAFNRRYYDDRLRRLTGEYALAMIDIDNLKQINDCYGHQTGDAVLYQATQTIRANLRSTDELIRYGGDEFLVLFHDLSGEILQRKLENLCDVVHCLRSDNYPELRISISIGGVYGTGTIEELAAKADRAMYRAKSLKNSAAVYTEEAHEAE